jgi:hypothetical protein
MVFEAKAEVGVKVAVEPEYEYDPVIVVAPCFIVNVVEVRVDEFMGKLKVADTVLFRATPVALFAGLTKLTVGGVVFKVVNVLT